MKKKNMQIVLVIIAIYLLFTVVTNIVIYVTASSEKSKTEHLPDTQYIVVLGNKLDNNKPSNTLIERLNGAIELSNKYPRAQIVVTGGLTSGNSITEAEVMKNYLIDNGISEDRIITEDQSDDTRENMANTKDLIEEGDTVIIVTNSFHMVRALMYAKAYSFADVYGYPVDNGQISTTIQFFFLEPIFILAHLFWMITRLFKA